MFIKNIDLIVLYSTIDQIELAENKSGIFDAQNITSASLSLLREGCFPSRVKGMNPRKPKQKLECEG